MQVAGRLASLGYPIVKKRSEELFAEFQRRLRLELVGFDSAQAQSPLPSAEPVANAVAKVTAAAAEATSPAAPATFDQPTAQQRTLQLPVAAERVQSLHAGIISRQRRIELVLVWPRVGISAAVGVAVAHGAVAFGQSPWWWLVAPLLGVAAGLGRRED
jgi:hypothetical protein